MTTLAVVTPVAALARPFEVSRAVASFGEVTARVRAVTVAKAKAVPPMPSGRVDLKEGAMVVHAYPPRNGKVAPALVMLHGMCGHPTRSCGFWSRQGSARHWLVCPSGNEPCGGSYTWSGGPSERGPHLTKALAAFERAAAPHVARSRAPILIGFSRGAYAARDAVYGSPPHSYGGLMLIGADIQLDVTRLKSKGIARVVMASGDKDGARRSMITATARLRHGGIEARFVSTGPIYHQLPGNLGEIVQGAVAWLEGQ